MSEILQLKNITIPTFDQKAIIVDDVSFRVKEKSIHAVIGPNGSGKSTLAYSIMGLPTYKISNGSIIFDGQDVTELGVTERAKMGITLAWQEPARIDGLSVLKYIALGIKDKTNLKEKVVEALNTVNMNPDKYLDRFVDDSLSGGERKRIELAAAIAIRPRLIILDEPTAGLDLIVIEDFLNIFNKIKALDMTILLITHREDIGMIADYATLLWGGKAVRTDTFPEVMLRYCAKANLKEFCKRTLFQEADVCFGEDYIDKIFEEEQKK
ncbi:MAG: ATP-binding cassette domain-containing protein [Candidatus Lokiarchaeota archaeon]|nr:ATP-binding cassette domain-containing protein [Candidatus Lokiarchaeota archaeon]